MGKVFLLVGFIAGAVVATTVGRKRIEELLSRPEVQDTWKKANRFVADKAPTLHDMGEAVADALPTKRAS
jgi:isopentenyl diphosphate isomerase/L-lactate dehydrogenase-like FMN-dependent dehydrogenase